MQAGVTTTVLLPKPGRTKYIRRLLTDRAVLVTALHEVAVYGLDQLSLLTEGFTALPIDVLGSDYYVMAYPQTLRTSSRMVDRAKLSQRPPMETQVTIVPTTSVGSRPANVPFNITLT